MRVVVVVFVAVRPDVAELFVRAQRRTNPLPGASHSSAAVRDDSCARECVAVCLVIHSYATAAAAAAYHWPDCAAQVRLTRK